MTRYSLYSDPNERALARVLAAARGVAPAGMRFAIQLGYVAKASAQRPWEDGGGFSADEDPWPTVVPGGSFR